MATLELTCVCREGENRGESVVIEEKLPDFLPARIADKCERKFKINAEVSGSVDNPSGDAKVNNYTEAKSKVVEEVCTWALNNWIKEDVDYNDQGDAKYYLTGQAKTKIVALYEDELFGVSVKKNTETG